MGHGDRLSVVAYTHYTGSSSYPVGDRFTEVHGVHSIVDDHDYMWVEIH